MPSRPRPPPARRRTSGGDKCVIMYYIASLAKFGNCCSIVWVRRQGHWKGKNLGISFSEEAAKKLHIVLQCIFGCDFLSPRITEVLGIENHRSASMSSCSVASFPVPAQLSIACTASDGKLGTRLDLAQLLPCLDL